MKYFSVLLPVLLVAMALGRFYAEAEVRQSERTLAQLSEQKIMLEREIDRVRLDVEVLESATRLRELNEEYLALRTVKAEQMVDDQVLAEVIGVDVPEKPSLVPQNADIIGNAIGMIYPSLTEKVATE